MGLTFFPARAHPTSAEVAPLSTTRNRLRGGSGRRKVNPGVELRRPVGGCGRRRRSQWIFARVAGDRARGNARHQPRLPDRPARSSMPSSILSCSCTRARPSSPSTSGGSVPVSSVANASSSIRPAATAAYSAPCQRQKLRDQRQLNQGGHRVISAQDRIDQLEGRVQPAVQARVQPGAELRQQARQCVGASS
jgi:hypothetical protein